jgi:hypothetical protein
VQQNFAPQAAFRSSAATVEADQENKHKRTINTKQNKTTTHVRMIKDIRESRNIKHEDEFQQSEKRNSERESHSEEKRATERELSKTNTCTHAKADGEHQLISHEGC